MTSLRSIVAVRRVMWTAVVFVALTVGVVLRTPLPALAHASMVASSPSTNQTVGGELRVIDLVFNEAVDVPTVEVLNPNGELVTSSFALPSSNHLRVELERPVVVEGEYRVGLRLISLDEDPLDVALYFTFDADADPALPVVATVVSSGGGSGYAWVGVWLLVLVISVLGARFLRARVRLRAISKQR